MILRSIRDACTPTPNPSPQGGGVRGGGASLAFLGLLYLAACAQHKPAEEGWRAISIEAAPADLGAENVGELKFLGGVQLRSQTAAFGGLSDIAVEPDGAFIAITDAGFFVRGKLALDENLAPTGVADVEIARMHDENGREFASKEAGDSEGLALAPDGRVFVSFEHDQVVRLYDLNDLDAAKMGPALEGASALPSNAGLEALTMFEDGRLLVGAEDSGMLWIADPSATSPVPRQARVDLQTGYGLVDFDRLPDGDFIALERFYTPVAGMRIKVVRIARESILGTGATRVTELAHMQAPLALDNFEGVSVVVHGGKTVLFIVSDDNFNARQRTLIYAFELK